MFSYHRKLAKLLSKYDIEYIDRIHVPFPYKSMVNKQFLVEHAEQEVQKLKEVNRKEHSILKSENQTQLKIIKQVKNAYSSLKSRFDDLDKQYDGLQQKTATCKEDCFWKGVHKKHILEDISEFKKQQLEDFPYDLKESLVNVSAMFKRVPATSLWQRFKDFFLPTNRQHFKRDKKIKGYLENVITQLDQVLHHTQNIRDRVEYST